MSSTDQAEPSDPPFEAKTAVVPADGLEADVPETANRRIPAHPALQVVRGFCMGAADTVPGVSGGTVALILGHYERLILAISSLDRHFVKLVLQRNVKQAFLHADLGFLILIGVGVVAGIISLAGLMHTLLDDHLPATFAVFFGMILASAWIVRRMIGRWGTAQWAGLVGGGVAAVGISLASQMPGSDSLVYLFVSAMIAICAMILPGISGAFILLLLGVYHPITGTLKETVKGSVTGENLVQIAVFCSGCLCGLLAFSRVLRWLLKHHHDTTMAALCGLMVGSVYKLWPFQTPTPETADLEFKLREFQHLTPQNWPGNSRLLIGLAIASTLCVLVIDKLAASKLR